MTTQRMHLQLSFKTSKGFTIVELMIASALGLILLAGVIQLFLGSNRNHSLQTELASIQEDGRFALTLLEREIQRASTSNDAADTPRPIDLLLSSEGTSNASDGVALLRIEDTDGVSNIDCNGAEVADGRVINHFYVDNGSLMCQGNGGGTAQPFISNVESFQVLYGIETDACTDGVVNSYVKRDSISASTGVFAVQVALLLRSQNAVNQTSESHEFDILDQTYTSPSDKFIRRLFKRTVYMPNAVFVHSSIQSSDGACISF
ncbi:PilW family protein [Aliikangiella sp. G2MR2-5]|uniref:PilW family protein n=1 Tax=Aliikangiella sp. G2MR2-5 TaxID=2788943 RepID=UPI0018AC6999|nr:PilW family protein [Aliikangiella sp. G2MR2-5]